MSQPHIDAHFFVNKNTDKMKVIEEAIQTSRGDWYSKPRTVQVHCHRADDPCADQEHHLYVDGEDVIEATGPQRINPIMPRKPIHKRTASDYHSEET